MRKPSSTGTGKKGGHRRHCPLAGGTGCRAARVQPVLELQHGEGDQGGEEQPVLAPEAAVEGLGPSQGPDINLQTPTCDPPGRWCAWLPEGGGVSWVGGLVGQGIVGQTPTSQMKMPVTV